MSWPPTLLPAPIPPHARDLGSGFPWDTPGTVRSSATLQDKSREWEGAPRLRASQDRDGKGAPWHVTADQDIWGRQNPNPQCLPVCPVSPAAPVVPAFPGDPDGEEGKTSGPGLPAACQTSARGIIPHALSSHSPARARLTRGPMSPASPFRPGCPGRPYKNRRAWRSHHERFLNAEMCPTKCILVGWAPCSGPHTSRTHQRSRAAGQPHGTWGTLHGKLGREGRRGVRGSGEAGQRGWSQGSLPSPAAGSLGLGLLGKRRWDL